MATMAASASTHEQRALLVVVGYQKAGKTSLMWRLREQRSKQEMPRYDSTNGLIIEEFTHKSSNGGQPIKFRFRTIDMGGQDAYFATHPFFFSERAVYLVCWSDLDGDQHLSMEHYIRTILAAAPDAPIVVVATKCEGDVTAEGVSKKVTKLKSQSSHRKADIFKNVHDEVLETSALTGKNIPELCNLLAAKATTVLEAVQVPSEALIAKFKKKALVRWRTDGKAPVARLHHAKLWCREVGLAGEDVDTALDVLHDLGFIVLGSKCETNFHRRHARAKAAAAAATAALASPRAGAGAGARAEAGATAGAGAGAGARPIDDADVVVEVPRSQAATDGMSTEWPLSQLVVLDPRWLAEVFATVITADGKNPAKTKGELHPEDLAAVWKGYPTTLQPTMLELLLAFEAVYPARGPTGSGLGYSIVPAMLPQDPPQSLRRPMRQFDRESRRLGRAACVHVELSHVPLHLFPRLQSRVQTLAAPEQNCLWRYGGLYRSTHHDEPGPHRALLWQPMPKIKPKRIEILVVGPWPFGLLWQLYQCLETLTVHTMGLTIDSTVVTCPRCRQTTFPLRAARSGGLKAKGTGDIKVCLYDCGGNRSAGPLAGVTAVGGGDELDDVVSMGSTGEDKTSFETAGFATWITGLGRKAPKKRAHVVETAFELAKTWEHDPNAQHRAKAGFVLEHACRSLEAHVRQLMEQKLGATEAEAVPALWTLVKTTGGGRPAGGAASGAGGGAGAGAGAGAVAGVGAGAAAGAGAGAIRLLPVCQHPGHLHVVSMPKDAHVEKLQEPGALTEAEANFLNLARSAILSCKNKAADKPFTAEVAGKGFDLLYRLKDTHKALGSPLKPLWQPTSTAQQWVCEEHYHMYVQPEVALKRDTKKAPPKADNVEEQRRRAERAVANHLGFKQAQVDLDHPGVREAKQALDAAAAKEAVLQELASKGAGAQLIAAISKEVAKEKQEAQAKVDKVRKRTSTGTQFDHLRDVGFDKHFAAGSAKPGERRGLPDADGCDTYVAPEGWVKFGLQLPAHAKLHNVAEDYHVAFRGTSLEKVRPILSNGRLAMAGETVIGGTTIGMEFGHAAEPYWRNKKSREPCGDCTGEEPCTLHKPDEYELFDPKTIRFSPSIKYCAAREWHKHKAHRYTDVDGKAVQVEVAFEVRVRPGSYERVEGNLLPDSTATTVDPAFDYDTIEWHTREASAVFLTGLLVRVTDAPSTGGGGTA